MESIDKIKRLAEIVSKNTAPSSNTNTLIGNLLKAMALYMAEQHHGAVGGYQFLNSIDDLPTGDLTDKQKRTGYVVGENIYFYVGTDGDTLDGEYQNGGSFHGTKGDDGLSAYEIWKAIPGNEGKTKEEFLASLRESGFTTEATPTRPNTIATIDNKTIYAVPDNGSDTWSEYIYVGDMSADYDETKWLLMARHNGSGLSSALADIVDLKDGLYRGFNPNSLLTQGGFSSNVGSVLETWGSSTNVMAIIKTPVRVSCNEGYYIRQIAGLNYDNTALASIYNNTDGISEYFISDDIYKRVAVQFKKVGGGNVSPTENVFKIDSGYTNINDSLQQISTDVEDCVDAIDDIKDVVTDIDEWIPKSPSTTTSSIPADSMIQGGISLKYDGNTLITDIPISQMITSATNRIYTKIDYRTFQSIKFIDGVNNHTYVIRCTDADDNFLGNVSAVATNQETTRQTIEAKSFSEDIRYLYVVVIPDNNEDIAPSELLELTTTQQIIKPFAESVAEAMEDDIAIAQEAKDKADEIEEWIPKFQTSVSENIPASKMEQGTVRPDSPNSGLKESQLFQNNAKHIRTKIDIDGFVKVRILDKDTYKWTGRYIDAEGYYIGDESLAPDGQETPDITKASVLAKSFGSRVHHFWLNVRRIDGEDLAPTEVLELTTLQEVTKSFAESLNSVLGNNASLKEYSLPLEYGYIENDGNMSTIVQRDTFFQHKRTPNFIQLCPFTLTLTDCSATIFLYDSNFDLVERVEYSDSFDTEDYVGTCIYFKIGITLNSDVTNVDDVSSVVFMTTNFKEIKNKYVSVDEIPFIYQVHTCCGRDVVVDDDTIEQLPEQKYYNSGLLRLPPNYNQFGKPSKLIFYAHASGQYQKITYTKMSVGSTEFPNGKYTPFYEYLQKEGYAIFDCFAVSNKYSNDSAFEDGGLASPTNMACITNAYEWVISHYNVDNSGVYVFGKSFGGIVCAAMLFQHSIPVKAVVPLAPQLDPVAGQFGYQANMRAMYVDDTGLDPEVTINGTTYTLIGTSSGNGMDPDAFSALCLKNINLLVGVVPTLRNIIQPEVQNLAGIWLRGQTNLNVKRLCSVPLKIFIARDDNHVSYQASVNFVNSIKATGGYAEIRRMPDHTGKHHAVDKTSAADVEADGEALVVNPTTALGYQCTDIPLAWVEMVEFFRRF